MEIVTPPDMVERVKTLELNENDLKAITMRATGSPLDLSKVRAVIDVLIRMSKGH